MRKIFIMLCLATTNSAGQNVLNAYNNSLNDPNDYDFENLNSNYLNNFIYSIPPGSGYYRGEFEIYFGRLPWYQLFIDPVVALGANSSTAVPYVYSMSYFYEVVSFPFHKECAYVGTGDCTEQTPCSTQVRNMNLPVEDQNHFTYMPSDNYFQFAQPISQTNTDKLFIKTPVNFVDSYYSSGFLTASNRPAHSLSSGAFKVSYGFPNERNIIPHSIIKTTIRLHCGPDLTFPVVNELSFYTDLTRARMRYYPFIPCNQNMGTSSLWDVIFIPEILYSDNQYTNSWNDLILSNGTLDYFPFGEIAVAPNSCPSVVNVPDVNIDMYNPKELVNYYNTNYANPTIRCQQMYNDIVTNSHLVWSNPFALNSCFLRNSNGAVIAGTELAGSSNITILSGIRHSYFIDQNTDLYIINPTEKEIYNPSEATITASNFVFPQDYTFKTIRGVYPSEAEALASRILENGCDANTDLRNVPVKTDLTTENTTDATNFPLSALPATQHLYASRYYLENNSKLTVQNCVRLFDCTFDVKQGATLLFDDYTAHYGKEDHSFDRTNTRFKIQTLGGAVLRNYNDVQYLQNGDITQTLPLHYKAIREIYAGSNVDPDQDIPKQDYVAQSGSNITLQAGEVIYLKEGFHAMSGSNVYITPTSPGGSAGPCNLPMAARMAGNRQQQPSKNVALSGLGIYPNPTSNVVKLHNRFMPLKAASVVIMDVYGRIVYEQTNFNSTLHTPDFSHEPDGMYMAKVIHHGKTETLKFMVQH